MLLVKLGLNKDFEGFFSKVLVLIKIVLFCGKKTGSSMWLFQLISPGV